MKTGTCYFPTYGAAMRYYRKQYAGEYAPTATYWTRREVDRKLNSGEIHIGKPSLRPGETLTIEDNRYHVQEAHPTI